MAATDDANRSSRAPQTVTVRSRDGVDLVVDVAGDGPPVIMVPGLGYGAWSWREAAEQLASDHRVVRLDNRGTGRSGKPTSGYSIDQMALDVVDVIEQLELGPSHLAGSSMGGYIALTTASNAPDLVASLTLVSTTIGGPDATRVPDETIAAWTEAAATLAPEDYARATMPLSFRRGWPEQHPAEFEQILDRRLEHPTPGFAWSGQFEACEHYLDVGAPSAVVDQPVLVVHGTDDRVVPYENTTLTLRRFPHAELVRLDGSGHLCWIEEAERVSDAIRDLVAEATTAPGSTDSTNSPNAANSTSDPTPDSQNEAS